MKRLSCLLSLIFLFNSSPIYAAGSSKGPECGIRLSDSATPRYRIGPLKQFESGLFGLGPNSARDSLFYFIAKSISTKKRLPVAEEVLAFIKSADKKKFEILRAETQKEFSFTSYLRDNHPALIAPPQQDASAELSKSIEELSDSEVAARFAALAPKLQAEIQQSYNASIRELVESRVATLNLDPEALAILMNPAGLVGPGGLFETYDDLYKTMREQYPVIYEASARRVWNQAFLFYRHRMVPPTRSQLRELLQYEDASLLDALIGQPGFWDAGQRSDIGRHIYFARKRIINAYARAIRGTDTALALRTRRIQPPLRRMVEIMLITRSNEHFQWRGINGNYGEFKLFEKDKLDEVALEKMMQTLEGELKATLGMAEASNEEWVFGIPRLFGKAGDPQSGLKELYDAARAEFQPTFSNFTDIARYPESYAKTVVDKVSEANGVLVASVKPGWPIDYDLVKAMVAHARESKYEILLIPQTGSLQDLDPRLLEFKEINLLTASFENREFLISNLPSNGRKEPFAPFKKPGMYRIGQQIIVESQYMSAEVIPTDQNARNQTVMFSSGTVNLPRIPAVNPRQMAKAIEFSRTMKRGYTVAEKVDKGTQNDMGGTTNHWHIRPVEWRPTKRDELKGGATADRGRIYEVKYGSDGKSRVTKRNTEYVRLVLPDVHFIVANPAVMSAIKDLVQSFEVTGYQVGLILPDPIDSKAINAHVEAKQQNDRELHRMMSNGQLDFNREINDAISNVNAFLAQFPTSIITFQYSNHSDEWIEKNMLNAPRWLQTVANGPIIDEMRFACRQRGWKPLEYLLVHRREFLDSVNKGGSEAYKDKYVFVSDPQRVRVGLVGETIKFGGNDPDYSVTVSNHGHMGSNGAKGSERTHQRANERSITGDSHRFGYMGAGDNFWISVGSTAFSQPYTAGGYSSWSVALGIVYDNNIMQPLNYDPVTDSFMQRPALGVLGRDFFGNDPLVVKGAMDDDQKRIDSDTVEFKKWLESNHNLVRPGLLAPPSKPKPVGVR